MGIESTVNFGIIIMDGPQAMDGFEIIIPDDEEFGGTYHFTYAYDVEMAHEYIFAGNMIPIETGEINS